MSDQGREVNSSGKKVALLTLGCKINQYDTSVIEHELRQRGNKIVPLDATADVIIINTCTVTARTDSKARQAIHRARGLHPTAILIVTGCYAQVQAEAIARIPGVDYIFGNADKAQIAASIEHATKQVEPCVIVNDVDRVSSLEVCPPLCYSGHTRAFIKIQDGCNGSCTYCIIPKARGRSRSMPSAKVLEHIEGLARQGFKEVVLCGVHLGHYGRDISCSENLFHLLCNIEKKALIPRVRISSIEPNELTDDLLELFAHAAHLCPHFHISVQSGDAGILAAMGRGYRPRDIEALIDRIVRRIPDVAIGIDVIVGFPGEDERAFENTMALVSSLPIAYCHVFPYSNRPGTQASRLSGQLDPETIQNRASLLRRLGKEKRCSFYRGFLGKSLPVLVERRSVDASAKLHGLSRNYIPVRLDGSKDLMNKEVVAHIVDVMGTEVYGRTVESSHDETICLVA